jgi:chorismate-pyruvate lyase
MAASWTQSFVTRVEALAVLQTLNADLLSHDSATATLERWCGAHKLATPAHMVAVRVPNVDKRPSAEQRALLKVAPDTVVRYRRVQLMCGTRVLSEADNWYVPERLSPQMNAQLDAGDTPFGVVVRALHFERHTLSSTLLWMPLPEDWEMGAGKAASGVAAATRSMPPQLLEHRAILALPDGTPFSEVIETYTSNVLAFAVP